MTNELFPPIATGLILSAVLAAIMSTASSQLLVAASAFAQDFYRTLLRKDAEQKELVWISRASVLVIASLAIFQIGRASCRDRVLEWGLFWGGGG